MHPVYGIVPSSSCVIHRSHPQEASFIVLILKRRHSSPLSLGWRHSSSLSSRSVILAQPESPYSFLLLLVLLPYRRPSGVPSFAPLRRVGGPIHKHPQRFRRIPAFPTREASPPIAAPTKGAISRWARLRISVVTSLSTVLDLATCKRAKTIPPSTG